MCWMAANKHIDPGCTLGTPSSPSPDLVDARRRRSVGKLLLVRDQLTLDAIAGSEDSLEEAGTSKYLEKGTVSNRATSDLL